MSTVNLTIRLDEALKQEIESAAAADDRSITDFVIRAAKARMATQCPHCGRSDVPGSVPPAFTPAFDAFLADVMKEGNKFLPILITTSELGQPRVYNGRLKLDNESHHGMVVLTFEMPVRSNGGHMEGYFTTLIPRGAITGWRYDQDQRHQRQLVALGYQNGNLIVAHATLAADARYAI